MGKLGSSGTWDVARKDVFLRGTEYSTEASNIGLNVGQWPSRIVLRAANISVVFLLQTRDEFKTVYRSLLGHTLVVFND